MEYLYYFFFAYVIFISFYFLTVIIQKKKYAKFRDSNQVTYFVNRFNIKRENIVIEHFVFNISLLNSLIMALSFTISFLVENFILQLMIGFISLIVLMFIGYEIYGIILKKVGIKNV